MRVFIFTGMAFLITSLCSKGNAASFDNMHRDTTLRILESGPRNLLWFRSMNLTAGPYGFKYYPKGGCALPKELSDSIKRENDITYTILEKRNGKGWRKRFIMEAAEMLKLQSQALKLAAKQRYVEEKKRELNNKSELMDFLVNPLPGNRQFSVKAFSYIQSGMEPELLIHYEMQVDLDKKTVLLLSSKAEKLQITL